ncbi:MAG: hypothetical protein HYX41_05885 [Bdellovibrio sp.]|nr:hypothetical protein [Bdellovibrio sp.]
MARKPFPTSNQVLACILILAAALRSLAAYFSIGFDHPNEVYRLLEPLAHLQGYSTLLPWEWNDHLLSWLPIRLQNELLHWVSTLGWTDSISQVRTLHFLYGILSLLQVYCGWRLVWVGTGSIKLAGSAALFLAIWPDLIYHSVRLMDYSLEGSFLAATVLLIFGNWGGVSKSKPELKKININSALVFLAGIFLGTLFFIRYQTGIHLISLLLVLLLIQLRNEVPLKKALWNAGLLSTAYGVTVLFLALLEAGTLSGILVPFRNYLHFNWTLGGAEKFYGPQPWHRYLSEIAKYYGYIPLLIGLGFILSALSFRRPRQNQAELIPGAFLAALVFIPWLAHSLIPHKEGRFIFGSLFLLVPAAFLSVENRSGKYTKAFVPWAQGLLVVGLVIGFSISLSRTVKKITVRAGKVLAFARAGSALQKEVRNSNRSLQIHDDPIHSPGAFFLRWRGPICYVSSNTDYLKSPLGSLHPSITQCSGKLDQSYHLVPHFSGRSDLELDENSQMNSNNRVIWKNPTWTLLYKSL